MPVLGDDGDPVAGEVLRRLRARGRRRSARSRATAATLRGMQRTPAIRRETPTEDQRRPEGPRRDGTYWTLPFHSQPSAGRFTVSMRTRGAAASRAGWPVTMILSPGLSDVLVIEYCGQLADRPPLERPGLRRAVLVRDVDLHERMRIAPHELGDDALDFDFLGGVVFRRKRVMREHLPAARQQRDTGDEHHDRAFHEASPSSLMMSTFLQAVVRRLDKHIGRPRAGRLAVPRVVIAGRPGRLHLGQRHPVLDHVLNPVPDDRDHVAVVHHVGMVADAAVGRNHPGPALGIVTWDGKFDELVQCIDFGLDAAARLRSIIGYPVRSNRSPELTTSDFRNSTTLLPSVVPVTCVMITGSSLK